MVRDGAAVYMLLCTDVKLQSSLLHRGSSIRPWRLNSMTLLIHMLLASLVDVGKNGFKGIDVLKVYF